MDFCKFCATLLNTDMMILECNKKISSYINYCSAGLKVVHMACHPISVSDHVRFGIPQHASSSSNSIKVNYIVDDLCVI